MPNHGHIVPNGLELTYDTVGPAESASSNKYELCTDARQFTPLVRSKQTGKWFSLPWNCILNLAVEAGIDE